MASTASSVVPAESWSIGASAVNVSNFVSAKLQFGEDSNNYMTWKEQMLCLIESQDLLGFINGAQVTQSKDYVAWRRSDRLVKGWILGALSEDIAQLCVGLDTARDVWLKLEKKFTQSDWGPPPADQERDYREYLPLYRAAHRGDLATARAILAQDPEAVKARLASSTLETALHIAVANRKALDFVEYVVQAASDEVLALTDGLGRNALHTAALMGNTAAARILVGRLPVLLYVADHKGQFPIHLAARSGHRETLEFLRSNTKQWNPCADASGVLLLCFVIDAGFYDIAVLLVEKYPDLAWMKDDESNSWALERISFKESAFPSGARLSYERLVDTGIPLEMGSGDSHQATDIEDPRIVSAEHGTWHKLVQHLQGIIKTLVPGRKRLHTANLMHWPAFQLVQCLCQNMASLQENEARSLYRTALMRAARLGIHEVVEEILKTFPGAVDTRRDGRDVFHVAAANRSDEVFNLIYRRRDRKHLYSELTDSFGNTILHSVAKLAPPHKLNRFPGAAVQMQRELQWFKEVERFVHPYARELVNHDGKTAKMVFTEEHKNLKAEGEKWIKDTAGSCIIASALVASVAFAAAITVPGANNSDTGYPTLIKSNSFMLFAVLNNICFLLSITSLLMFISIMTERYAEEDFLIRLPCLLLVNLYFNFLSIIFLMFTFAASAHFLVGREHAWVLILMGSFSCIPISILARLQFRLCRDVFYSTFGATRFLVQNELFY